ncbi:MAG: hypothetical protein LBR08_12535 [Bacteroidales bacterium]|nr:hypothetical protein [Bacteroidales bacterium]
MKKIILGAITGICFMALLGAGRLAEEYQAKKSTAEVARLQNLYVFSDSTPVKDYEYLGTVKIVIRLLGSGQYTDIRDALIKKAKKEYPDAEGIILNPKDYGADRADVIKFK